MKNMLNQQLARREYFWFAPVKERFETEDKALIESVKVWSMNFRILDEKVLTGLPLDQ